MTATSSEVMPTWDAENIVADMLKAMERRVFALSAYTTAETAFLNCVARRAGTRHTSFDVVLGRYTGRTKTAVDACETSGAPRSGALPALSATTMFATYQRLSKQELTAMRRTNTEYDALLSTDMGKGFLDDIGDPDILKRYATYVSGHGMVSGSSGTGFECIPRSAPSALSAKIQVLNCLVFDTPHRFWEDHAIEMEKRIKNPSGWPNYGFLATDADGCTGIKLPSVVVLGGLPVPIGGDTTPDGPTVACRKHDVAYASLQKFEGTRDSQELDAAWNPVNKYLSDSKFRRDIQTYGCQDPSWRARVFCAATTRSFQASFYHFGVAIINSKGWPVTVQDIEHGEYRLESGRFDPEFVDCASPQFPQISNLRIQRVQQTVTAQWDFQAGCAVGLNDVNFELKSYRGARTTIGRHNVVIDSNSPRTTCSTTGNRTACSYTFPQSRLTIARTITVQIAVQPKSPSYGGSEYPGSLTAKGQL